MSYRLPPLATLRLFEAAARHLSFKQAALELHVTPSAVSHGIQTLEDWLGTPLFVRYNRGLALTGAGAVFQPQVREALSLLARAVETVPGRRSSGKLSVSAAPTFASRWLLPNLPRFRALRPDIEVTIDTQHRQMDFPRDGVDLAIRMGRGPWQDLYALKLVTERLVPVAAPAVAAGIGSIDDLAKATLLRVVAIADDWDSWFALRGAVPPAPLRSISFDAIHMALDAAVGGLGVALGRLPLAQRDLDAGTLVPLLGPPVPCTTAYWLVGARESLSNPDVAAFRNWIRAELADQDRRSA